MEWASLKNGGASRPCPEGITWIGEWVWSEVFAWIPPYVNGNFMFGPSTEDVSTVNLNNLNNQMNIELHRVYSGINTANNCICPIHYTDAGLTVRVYADTAGLKWNIVFVFFLNLFFISMKNCYKLMFKLCSGSEQHPQGSKRLKQILQQNWTMVFTTKTAIFSKIQRCTILSWTVSVI